jgi:aminotransferase EvaB
MRAELLAATARVLDSGSLILGAESARFEKAFARTLGRRPRRRRRQSAPTRWRSALWALGVRPDDEVITTPNTAVPTVSAIRMAGAIPVFCDVDERTP